LSGGFPTEIAAAQYIHQLEIDAGRKSSSDPLDTWPSDEELLRTTPDAFFARFPWNASLAIQAHCTGNLTPPWAVRQGLTFSGPKLAPGMKLTKVVDIVDYGFSRNCCEAPKKQWYAASKPTDMTPIQEHFEDS